LFLSVKTFNSYDTITFSCFLIAEILSSKLGVSGMTDCRRLSLFISSSVLELSSRFDSSWMIEFSSLFVSSYMISSGMMETSTSLKFCTFIMEGISDLNDPCI
jgi:hypothetical protein